MSASAAHPSVGAASATPGRRSYRAADGGRWQQQPLALACLHRVNVLFHNLLARPARHLPLAALALAIALQAPHAEARPSGKPGAFAYYVLALSWSPTYCETQARGRNEPQCAGGRPFAFVLHGLWPQYEKGWPQNCDIGKRPWVPRKLIDAMLDIMPSPKLVIFEYRKHGTCSGLSPEDYYATARRLYEQIRIPARYLRPNRYVVVTPREIEADFLATNRDLKPDMIAISCGRGRHLREVRICFSRDLALTPCGANEDQAKLCGRDKIVMPPVRGG